MSCGKQAPMVKDLSVGSNYVGDDLYLNLDASLSIGNVNLPNVSIPVICPKTLEQVGLLQMQGGSNSQNLLKLKLNVSAISDLDSGQSTLPNGVTLPLIAQNKVIEIPIANKVKVYVSIGESVVALGVAVPFKTFDRIGQSVGQSAIFPMFYLNQVIGSAGIYTSRVEGENGFAIFADVSNAIEPIDFLNLRSTELDRMEYISKVPTDYQKRKIDISMLKLHRQRKQLRLL